jgi:hypothetical protein
MLTAMQPVKRDGVHDGQYAASQSHVGRIACPRKVCFGTGTASRPPNGLAFSCRERAG